MSNLTFRNGNLPTNLRENLFIPFEQVFDNFFTDFFKGTNIADKVKAQSTGYPKVDVSFEDKEIVLRAAIPGVKQEDVVVEMIDNYTVEISGKVSEEYNHKDTSYQIRELTKRNFSRRISFIDELSDPKSAIVKDGVLTLRWNAKQTKEPEKRLIQVKAG